MPDGCIFDERNGVKAFEFGGTGEGMKTDFGTLEILSRREAAVFLGICLTTLDRLDIPRTRLRHRVVYKRDVLCKWIDEHTENGKKGKA